MLALALKSYFPSSSTTLSFPRSFPFPLTALDTVLTVVLGCKKNMASHDESEESYLDRIAPKGLKEFDAFPKLPSTYKEQSGSRGLFTILIGLLAFIFVLNDVGEYIWGWPSYTFNVEHNTSNFMDVNVDVIVNMPCGCECYLFSLFENFKH